MGIAITKLPGSAFLGIGICKISPSLRSLLGISGLDLRCMISVSRKPSNLIGLLLANEKVLSFMVHAIPVDLEWPRQECSRTGLFAQGGPVSPTGEVSRSHLSGTGDSRVQLAVVNSKACFLNYDFAIVSICLTLTALTKANDYPDLPPHLDPALVVKSPILAPLRPTKRLLGYE